MEQAESTHPPKAKLVVRVGVTGHRPGGLQQADMPLLRTRIRDVLVEIDDVVRDIYNNTHTYFAGNEPVLRIISPLAEGSDRLVAQEALKLGYELQCPLPFEREEYEKDFMSPDSLSEFNQLLNQASAVLEIVGSRRDEALPYQAVGQMVLNQCDILIAVWDGEEAHGKGGTGQIVELARQQMIPNIWIQAQNPHKTVLRGLTSDTLEWQTPIKHQLTHLLNPPQPEVGPEKENHKHLKEPELLEYYFEEKHPKFNWGFPYKIFRNFVGGGNLSVPKIILKDFAQASIKDWEEDWKKVAGLPNSLTRQINNKYGHHFAWSDRLADYYADIYRSSFITLYLLSGLAVLGALLSYALHNNKPVYGEIIIIGIIGFITLYGNYRCWHQRWIDYRFLSELFRLMRFLAPLGLMTSSFRIPAHATSDSVRSSWVNWHFRAVCREAGLLNARIDDAYLKDYWQFLKDVEMSGQVEFHNTNLKRSGNISHRLHWTGNSLFIMTLVAAVAHCYNHSEWWTVFAAVFPAFGAAFAGILFQGEFARLEQRSDAMYHRLSELMEIEIRYDLSLYDQLKEVAEAAAECMLTEVLDWHIMFKARPLNLPA